jgi:hypothetical protein
VKHAHRDAGRGEEELTLFGVGCEACHGPAEKWLKPHSLPDWKKDYPEPADKEKLGMWPIHKSYERARRCVTCHVGSSTSDMNHDLIAAGHPRLNFEFTVFMANMPRHWNKNSIPDLRQDEAWVLGQAVTATAALDLLAYRADPPKAPDGSPKPWPEFAEYDCFSCHHDLQGVPNWRQEMKFRRPVGALVWNNWYMTMPRAMATLDKNQHQKLLDTLDTLAKAMREPLRERQTIVKQAQEAEKLLRSPGASSPARQLLNRLIMDYRTSSPDWDHAAQIYLAAAALDHDTKSKKVIEELAKKLSYPQDYDSPHEDRKKTWDAQRSEFEALLKQLSK